MKNLWPELKSFDVLTLDTDHAIPASKVQISTEEIVQVRGSSACFEYQFPASPEYFVGRATVLSQVDEFVTAVIDQSTSSRGMLFEANSGWGKSSVVLAAVARLNDQGHFAIAIDSRSASSSQFVLRAVDYILDSFGRFGNLGLGEPSLGIITGFDGACEALLQIGKALRSQNKVLFVVLDQFENVFFLPDALQPIRNLFLRLCDAQTNVAFGFSWKTDLIGLMSEFPYRMRDDISGISRRITLETFSDSETNELLDKLSQELNAHLRRDLRFFLSEFSQGYPWLLKKLCAHVKAQREKGVPQEDIASSLLNVEELFQDDLRGLSAQEEETLLRISKAAPIGVQELGEQFKPEIVQSLVNARLVVRVGTKYDIYWDIFRDYLNYGRVPVQDNYILRLSPRSILSVVQLLIQANGVLGLTDVRQRANQKVGSFYNTSREMRLLGLATIDDGKLKLQVDLQGPAKRHTPTLQAHLRERLLRNRIISQLIDMLEVGRSLPTHQVAALLRDLCPYISASEKTWRNYARTFMDWLDVAGLASYDTRQGQLLLPSDDRQGDVLITPKRGRTDIPPTYYGAIEQGAVRVVDAAHRLSGQGQLQETIPEDAIDWTGFTVSTAIKVLLSLKLLGLVIQDRRSNMVAIQPKCVEFVSDPDSRPIIFARAARKIKSFAAFLDILVENEDRLLSLLELGRTLEKRLGADWADGTAEGNAKVLMNWARYTYLAPSLYMHSWNKDELPEQMSLFGDSV